LLLGLWGRYEGISAKGEPDGLKNGWLMSETCAVEHTTAWAEKRRQTADRRPLNEERPIMREFKFERLEVWQLSLEYLDLCYAVAERFPKHEEYNLKSQITRAATSIALNIAEGSKSQGDAEQARFLGLSLHSLVETVACRRLIHHRGYVKNEQEVSTSAEQVGQKLFAKLQAMRRVLTGKKSSRSVVSGQQSAVSGQQSAVN
jgi:four helix bundle protein